jgi:hypothetical protein
MNNKPLNIDNKVKNNAIIAYLFILVNITFLFNKSNTLLNNSFVKTHTKTAILIHLWFLINTIVFVYYWLGFYGEVMGYSISDIIAISIYLILFWFMIVWIYKAYCWKLFMLWESINYKNNKKLLDIDSSWSFDEKDKLTIIISKIPFLWFFIYPRYKNNKLIESNTKLNLILTILIVSLYVFWNPNLANLLLLFYIIFIVFTSINLFVKNEVINIKLESIPNLDKLLIYSIVLLKYLWNYFKAKDFPSFEEILKKVLLEQEVRDTSETKKLEKLSNFKLWKYIIYIPILNIIALFNINSKQKIHIINWILITLSFIILALIYWINNKYQLLLLLPLFFSIWYMNTWILNYKIPFLYNIFELFVWIKNSISGFFTKIRKIKNTEKEVKMKVSKMKLVK